MASDLALKKHWVNKHWCYHIQNQPEKGREGVGGVGLALQLTLSADSPSALFHTHTSVFPARQLIVCCLHVS